MLIPQFQQFKHLVNYGQTPEMGDNTFTTEQVEELRPLLRWKPDFLALVLKAQEGYTELTAAEPQPGPAATTVPDITPEGAPTISETAADAELGSIDADVAEQTENEGGEDATAPEKKKGGRPKKEVKH